ncbi:hypothetical protein WA588_000222 [Blastocystis sp. NMH]
MRVWNNHVLEEYGSLRNLGVDWTRQLLHVSHKQASFIFNLILVTGVYVAATLLIIVILGIREYKKRKSVKPKSVALIVGERGSGKTAMLNLIAVMHQAKVIDTSTTEEAVIKIEVNADTEMALEDLSVVLLKDSLEDISTSRSLNRFLSTATCLLVVVDGTHPKTHEIAVFLSDLFNNSRFLQNPLPILLCVNKSDRNGAVHSTSLYYAVQKEVGCLQNAEADYEFRKYSPCTIDCCNCSVTEHSIRTVDDFLMSAVY